MLFDWDEGNIAKCQKHGVSIGEIEFVLSSSPHITEDPYPHEARFRIVGKNKTDRVVFIVFTLRKIGPITKIRPVSARYMHQKEMSKYFQNNEI